MSARTLLALNAAGRGFRAPGILRRSYHNTTNTGGLLYNGAGARNTIARRWPVGSYSIHNLPAVRHASFARALPKLAAKLLRLPAMAGATAIGGFAYIQYQAAQAGTYALGIYGNARDTAASWATTFWDETSGIAGQIGTGWERTKDQATKASSGLEAPEWLTQIMNLGEGKGGNGGSGGGPHGDGPEPSTARAGAAGVATGAAFGYAQSSEDDERSEQTAARDDQMMMLTKKMIEIRNILQQVGQSDVLTLPSIVVIGSQSSGKSSVLEAIVGHEFLPKGSNMVTRRPIELTLVNTPDAQAEYGVFPALGTGKITDFSHIQRTLTDLNLAVPVEDCVSDDPIQLHIYSPNVPDLSLIDLPGYIQVASADQPPELKQKIVDLCDKYIQPPNVILAISAADVDLANSTSLRSSRRVDPRGERTIGVITKMDLVDPERGASMLNDRKYPLRLGYVGVITKAPAAAKSMFSRGSGSITSAVSRNENAYFSQHPLEFGPQSDVSVGTTTLRKKLMTTLENVMASSLQGTSDAVRQELEEATYEFKVQYNDRPLSAESYLAESLDAFKHDFKEFAESFGRPQVRELLKQELDQRVLDLLAQRYWNKPVEDLSVPLRDADPLSSLPSADPESVVWHRRLDASTSALTKLGIGRLATTVVAEELQSRIDDLIAHSTFAAHPFARDAIHEAAAGILNDRFYSTSDQVENCIKPYKFEIEVDDGEWAKGRANVALVLKKELVDCEAAHKRLSDAVGGKRKLNDVVAFIDRARKGDITLEGSSSGGAGGFSAALLAKGREAVFLRDRADLLRLRMTAIKSKQCGSRANKYFCPEVFLDVVADKLVATSVLFLNVELLSEFYYNFPRELDARLGRHLSTQDVERFAREDPRIRGHLDVIRRKELLEMVLEKMESLRQLDGRERVRADTLRPRGQREGKGWSGLF